MADTTVGRLFPLATDDYRGAAWFARTFVGGKNGTVEWGGQASVGDYLLWFQLIASYTNQQLLLASAYYYHYVLSGTNNDDQVNCGE